MYAKAMQRREKKRQEEDVKRFSEPGEDSDEELEADGGAPMSAHGGGEGLRCESKEMQAHTATPFREYATGSTGYEQRNL